MSDREEIIDEINKLIDKYNGNPNREAMSEANVRTNFIDPFFERVLGWNRENSEEYDSESFVRYVGFADIALKVDGKPKIYVEAKKFGIIPSYLDRSVQTDLNGNKIYADWTDEERQVLNYAGANVRVKWAILTNFEKFRLFNAKTGITVLNIENPNEYLEKIDDILLLTQTNVSHNNIDKLEERIERPDIDLHFLNLIKKWQLKLAKEIYHNNPSLSLEEINLYVQRIIDRFVIVRFAEDNWVLDDIDQLKAIRDSSNKVGYMSLTNMLINFFDGFDDEHNSKIFEKNEKINEIIRNINDETFNDLIKELYDQSFRKFTSDILGNTYENYLSSKLCLEDGELHLQQVYKFRKANGIYYTPPYIVEYIVKSTLGKKLEGLWYEVEELFNQKDYENAVLKFNEIYNIKVLDPACGSGSFLIKAHDTFLEYYNKYKFKVNNANKELKKLVSSNEINEWEFINLTEFMKAPLKNFEKRILKKNIYGVDLDENAAEIASVNLMLRALKPHEKLPLILYENIKVGNSLISGVDDIDELMAHSNEIKELIILREEIKNTQDRSKKAELEKKHDKLKIKINNELNENLYDYFDDLGGIKPFNWEIEFPEAFYDENGNLKENSGFDIVIGNPPYFNVQTLGAGSPEIDFIKNRYSHVWMDKSDILFYFIARGVELSNLYVSYIISNAFLFADKAKNLRNFILEDAPISTIINFERYHVFKDASITTAIINLDKLKSDTIAKTLAFASANHSKKEICETIRDNSKYFDIKFKKDEVFAIVSYEIDKINRKVDGNHSKLGQLVFVGKGMETAANPVYTFDKFPSQFDGQFIKKRANNEIVQSYLLNEEKEYLLYFEDIEEFNDLPIEIQNYLTLKDNKEKLENRAEIIRNSSAKWWKYTFPLHKELYHLNKIFSPYRAKNNRFALDESSEFIGLTDTTIIFDTNPEISLKYLLALLNSKVLTVRYKSIGKPTGGGLHEYFENQITKLPIPEIPLHEQEPFIKIVDEILTINKQKRDLIKLYDNLVKLSGQNKKIRTLKYYLEPRNSINYHINLSKTTELISNDKEDIPRRYDLKKQGDSIFINVLYSDDSSEDVLKITFNNDSLREFFYLAIFSSVDGITKKYTKEGNILERVKKDIKIPQNTNNKAQDVDNITNLIELLKNQYKTLLAQYSYKPITDLNLELMIKKIKEKQVELDKLVFDLYGLDSAERQLINEVTS